MIVSIDIKAIEPLAGGGAFGDVGPYERVIGVAKGEVDPKAPGNSGIALIDKAPLNERGKVEYTTDFFILRPKDPAKGNGRILYEVNNRGRKMLFGNIADGPQGINDPQKVADLGNGFPLRRGWTIVWSGWDPDAPRANLGLGLTAPVATDGGKPIVQTVRERQADKPQDVAWAPVDGKTIKLAPDNLEGGKPKPGYIYEFTYQGTKPKVQGLGFAATRDFVSWLRHDAGAVRVTGRPG